MSSIEDKTAIQRAYGENNVEDSRVDVVRLTSHARPSSTSGVGLLGDLALFLDFSYSICILVDHVAEPSCEGLEDAEGGIEI